MKLTAVQLSIVTSIARGNANIIDVNFTAGSIPGYLLVGFFDKNGNLVRDLTLGPDGRVWYDYTPTSDNSPNERWRLT